MAGAKQKGRDEQEEFHFFHFRIILSTQKRELECKYYFLKFIYLKQTFVF